MNILADHARLARLNTTKRAIWRALRTHDQDLFWHRRHWVHFEQMLDRYLAALDGRADPRIIKGLRDMDLWRQRNGELIDLVLDHPPLATRPQAARRASGRRARPARCRTQEGWSLG